MIVRSGLVLSALVTKFRPFSRAVGKSGGRGEATQQPLVYVPSSSEAPELLRPYVTPTPFVSAKRLQVFLASFGVGATTIGGVYYFLSRSMSNSHEEELRYVQRVMESNRLAMKDQKCIIPEFTAPSSFAELKAKMRQHEFDMEKQLQQMNRDTVMLHREVLFRLKVWWNACLTQLQESCDQLGVMIQRRKRRAAEANIKHILDDEGYELVRLRNGKTHIW